MGRHARGVGRSRLTTTAGIAVPVALIVAAGSWWAVDSSHDGSTVTGSAVVVSSLACLNGDEGTVVDLLDPVGQPPGTTRRATMDSCGHREGEVLAVDYSTDDPGRVVPAAADSDGDTGRQLMPLGLVLAAMLGLAALVAVVRDARRHHTRTDPVADGPAPRGRHARPDEEEPTPMADDPEPVVVARPSEIDLLFPDHDRLAVSLHDELFTHRSPAGV